MDPRPKQTVEALTSEIAAEAYDREIRLWGEAGWQRVGRLCRWFEANGMPNLDCPPPPPDS